MQQFLRHELCHRSYVQSNVYASAIDSAICKIVEVLGWVRNLVRITSALVLFTPTLGRMHDRMIKFLPTVSTAML